jgi:tRNA/tmRNA/rRNA uracil-C5-methylase (TrmA/RlmC/RlmD family)
MGDMLGKRVELDVTNIAHGGVAVARLDGRVVFVSDAIPGERVVARISADSKKSFWRAETVEVLTPSEHRQPHIWAEAALDRDPDDRAGGAEFGHIAPEHQRELKRRVLADALHRMAAIDFDGIVEKIDGDPRGIGWRTRIRLHVDETGRPGPYAARSHRVIPISTLPLATVEINEIAPLGESFEPGSTLDLLSPSRGGARMFYGNQKPSTITELVGEREFRLADTGFWQVHRAAPAALTEAVQTAIHPEHFDPRAANLDLYGGVGLLAAAVADRFGPATRITTVESDATATEYAGSNLAEWTGAQAVTGRVERWLADYVPGPRAAAATVILDPPRSGAGADVIERLVASGPAQVVYVACDPVAFARDARLLADRGYSLITLRALDLFPNTHHLEAVGTFLRD